MAIKLGNLKLGGLPNPAAGLGALGGLGAQAETALTNLPNLVQQWIQQQQALQEQKQKAGEYQMEQQQFPLQLQQMRNQIQQQQQTMRFNQQNQMLNTLPGVLQVIHQNQAYARSPQAAQWAQQFATSLGLDPSAVMMPDPKNPKNKIVNWAAIGQNLSPQELQMYQNLAGNPQAVHAMWQQQHGNEPEPAWISTLQPPQAMLSTQNQLREIGNEVASGIMTPQAAVALLPTYTDLSPQQKLAYATSFMRAAGPMTAAKIQGIYSMLGLRAQQGQHLQTEDQHVLASDQQVQAEIQKTKAQTQQIVSSLHTGGMTHSQLVNTTLHITQNITQLQGKIAQVQNLLDAPPDPTGRTAPLTQQQRTNLQSLIREYQSALKTYQGPLLHQLKSDHTTTPSTGGTVMVGTHRLVVGQSFTAGGRTFIVQANGTIRDNHGHFYTLDKNGTTAPIAQPSGTQ